MSSKRCILITGIPASGKSTLAEYLEKSVGVPLLSKDKIKEILYDTVGFESRAGKVKLGDASMEIMYEMAGHMMKCGCHFLLENNFENVSRDGIANLLQENGYEALTIRMTGDYETIYRRFLERDRSGKRHRGHVVNDRYPETAESSRRLEQEAVLTFENFLSGIERRGMDSFRIDGPELAVDTTDFNDVNFEAIASAVRDFLVGGKYYNMGRLITGQM